jgi:DNA-binding NarL/FixJ family response regulator
MPASPRVAATMAEPRLDPTADLRGSVTRLAAEGLSDRAIARQLHVGLEEVRMTRARTGNAS